LLTSKSGGRGHLKLTNIRKAKSGGRGGIDRTESRLRHGRLVIVLEDFQFIDLGDASVVDFRDDRGFLRMAAARADASAREVENKVGHGLALGAVEVRGVTADLHGHVKLSLEND
jgi:hypothetical protein